MKLIIGIIWLTGCMSWDIFTAYNCKNPTNMRFVTHEKCKETLHQENKKDFTLIQTDKVSNMSAIKCKVEETSITRYCGAYSHDKSTGLDFYDLPKLISPEECRRLSKELSVTIGDKSHTLELNKVNYVKSFTHGGVSFATTNVYCVGEVLTLDSGMAVSNMMKEVHMKIHIQEINLINDDGNVIYPQHQSRIGREEEGYGAVGMSTIIWKDRRSRCQKTIISTIDMMTNDGTTYYNHPHMIQIKTKEEFYDNECGIKLIATDLPGIYLADVSVQKNPKMKRMHTESIHMDSHYTTQLRFLADEMERKLQQKYSFINSPACHEIMNTQITTRLGSGRFVKNLGDVSIYFQCSSTTVTSANITESCYKHLPVLDENRHLWYLDPTTRVLLNHGAKTQCNSANVPVYKNLEGEFISYLPKRTPIRTEEMEIKLRKDEGYAEDIGLYPGQVVAEWLSSAYMQHFQEISYTALYADICNKKECEDGPISADGISDALTEYYEKIRKMPIPGSFLGIDFVSLGGHCSIAVCCILILYTVNYLIGWFVRFLMLKDGNSTAKASFFRACCLNLYLIAKMKPVNEQESNT